MLVKWPVTVRPCQDGTAAQDLLPRCRVPFSPRHKRNGVYFKHVPETILQATAGFLSDRVFRPFLGTQRWTLQDGRSQAP